VSLFATNRLPGQTATGSIGLNQSQQVAETLAQAADYQNQGKLSQAVGLYQSVLDSHPANEVALAQLGWLEFETGQQGVDQSLIHDGLAKLNRAVGLDPSDYAVRLYLGTVQLQYDDNAAGAVAQYRDFLADGPPATLVRQAAPEIRNAFQQAGLTAPAAVGG
jgi:cytochrome c-type biogenesis protein CcmH/NrfG